MANVVVVGAQWGDEGKGKIVDWLSERAGVIARFQGGHNAGHTLVIGDKVFKLSLLPSGIVREGKLAVIGNGVVLDPWALFAEIDKLGAQGVAISTDNLMIAENTPLILPLHQDLARLREAAAGKAGIGTTPQKSLFAKLERLTGDGAAAAPAWLRTHPRAAERIAAIEANERRWQIPQG